MSLSIEQIYHNLRNFDFASLFVRELHWFPPVSRKKLPIDEKHSRYEIARYMGVPVFEVTADDGTIPPLQVRDRLHREISPLFPRSLLIFIDGNRAQSIWHWIKRERARAYSREYFYAKGQPEDLLLNKLSSIVTDIIPTDEQRGSKGASDSRKKLVTHRIYEEFQAQRRQFSEYINGIDKEQDRDLYASILLNRLVFLYFLQQRGFIDEGNKTYLEDALRRSHKDCYYRAFLLPLFFEGLSKPAENRSTDIRSLLGKIIYLDGGLFQPHTIERQNADIQIPNTAFEQLFSFFSEYTWQIVDIPSGDDNEITPDMLGHIFEMHFNQVSGVGASYTPPEIPEYLCRQTIHGAILEKVRLQASHTRRDDLESIEGMLAKLDVRLCRRLLFEVLPSLSVLDPACGSGTFLVAAMNTLVTIYSEVINKIASLNDDVLSRWLYDLRHPSYYLKKNIITNNLYGVDISEDAIETTCLRLYLALIASVQSAAELEPLSDIGFHLSVGNSLIGLLRVGDIHLPEERENNQAEVIAQLNRTLLTQLHQRERRYRLRRSTTSRDRDEQGAESRPNIEDIGKLTPIHWAYEFPQIMNEQGGFDVIMTNPPWEVLRLPRKQESETAYYESIVLQLSPQYEYQNPVVNGRTQRTDVNLYKLFVEQSYNLLCNGGYCGMVVPHGICIDQGTQRLRELLFTKTRITGLFCFENRRKTFDGLDSRFKIALLTFEKGGPTKVFPAAFAREDVAELDHFPTGGAVNLMTDFIRRFSPGLLVVAEFRNQRDISISEKMLRFPLLGEKIPGTWNVELAIDVFAGPTRLSDRLEARRGNSSLYEGRMIDQFSYMHISPEYRLDRGDIPLTRRLREERMSGYHSYRLAFRTISSSSNERTLIADVLPPDMHVTNTADFISNELDADVLMFLTAIFNSFVIDFSIRLRVSSRITNSSIYQLPIPRLNREDTGFWSVVKRAARLICTGQEYKGLWEEAMSNPWYPEVSVTNPIERNQLRAELDGLIAHLYNVTEEELAYILSTFPRVADPIKVAAQNAYRDVERGLIV